MRVATIDIGTNTTLMLVTEKRDGEVVAIEDHAEITRLGQGVDKTHRLDEQAIARTLAALSKYAARAKELGVSTLAAVGTSASRDAENGGVFRAAAAKILGGEVAIVSGPREAELTFRGALGGLGLKKGASVGVIDVGGGSTELVLGRVDVENPIVWSHSYDVGSVRMTERWVKSDPIVLGELRAMEVDILRVFAEPKPPVFACETIVAIAGTATSYAAIDKKLVNYADDPPHGHVLSCERLRALVTRLNGVPLSMRQKEVGLEPKRADVIVAGGLVLSGAAAALGAESIVVSDRGVRWGLALELLAGTP